MQTMGMIPLKTSLLCQLKHLLDPQRSLQSPNSSTEQHLKATTEKD